MISEDQNVYINTCFGDFWVQDGSSLVRINTGEIHPFELCETFIQVGKIHNVSSLDLSFYEKLEPCPFCKSSTIMCIQDISNFKWKIGCSSSECPCCINGVVGRYSRREEAIYRWNAR